MKNAAAILTKAWVTKTDKEATTEWAKWDKSRQKKWSDEYLKTSLEVWGMVADNATESATRITAIKNSMKLAVDGAEKILEASRKSGQPLGDAQRSWLDKAADTIEGSKAAVGAITEEFSRNSPFAGRLGYYDTPLEKGALTKAAVDKIKAARAKSIDIGDTYGKAGPLTLRMEEYRKRWTVLQAELQGLEKQRAGQAQEWAASLTKRIHAFVAGDVEWQADLQFALKKVTENIGYLTGHLDSTEPKNFGAALLKSLKVKVDAKAKAKSEKDAKTTQNFLVRLAGALKLSKGKLKTRVMEFKALSESIKGAGPHGEPFVKMLAPIGLKLAEHQKTVDGLVKDVDAAIQLAGK